MHLFFRIMRQLSTLILFFFSVHLSAQIKYFTEVSGNLSLISNSVFTDFRELKSNKQEFNLIEINDYKATYQNKFGGGIAVGLQYFFNSEISIETALDISAQRLTQELLHTSKNVYIPKTGNEDLHLLPNIIPSALFSKNTYSLMLLSLPISVSYHTLENNLSAGVGFVPASVLTLKKYGTKSDNFNPFALGVQIHLRYRFAENTWVTATLQEFTTALYKREEKLSTSENRLLKIGLRYDL